MEQKRLEDNWNENPFREGNSKATSIWTDVEIQTHLKHPYFLDFSDWKKAILENDFGRRYSQRTRAFYLELGQRVCFLWSGKTKSYWNVVDFYIGSVVFFHRKLQRSCGYRVWNWTVQTCLQRTMELYLKMVTKKWKTRRGKTLRLADTFCAEKQWTNRIAGMGKDGIMVSRILTEITLKSEFRSLNWVGISRSQGKIRTKKLYNMN